MNKYGFSQQEQVDVPKGTGCLLIGGIVLAAFGCGLMLGWPQAIAAAGVACTLVGLAAATAGRKKS